MSTRRSDNSTVYLKGALRPFPLNLEITQKRQKEFLPQVDFKERLSPFNQNIYPSSPNSSSMR